MRKTTQYHIQRIHTADEIQKMMSSIPDMVARLEKRTDPRKHYEKLATYAENFVLFSNEAAVAYTALYANDHKSKCAYITFIGCVSDKRHMGYGKILFDYVCCYARTEGFNVLRLEVAFDNDNAIKFYKKMGMYEIGKTAYGLIMEKPL